MYGPQPQPLEGLSPVRGVALGGVYLDSQYLAILAVSVVAVGFQYFFFEHTLLGKKLQATSQDKDMARLLGIRVVWMTALTFMYSAMLGGLAGILVAPVLFVSIGMGSTIALKAFAATIIGGFGDVTGAIVGGLLLGVVESFAAAYVSVPYKDAFGFLLILLFLLVRPQGIFGERGGGKGMRGSGHAGRRRLPVLLAGLAALLPVAVLYSGAGAYALNILMQAATYAIAVLGMTVVLGFAGQINLAQATFFGMGAYAVALGTVSLRAWASGSRCCWASASRPWRAPCSA